MIGSVTALLLGLSSVHSVQAQKSAEGSLPGETGISAQAVGDYQVCGYGQAVGASSSSSVSDSEASLRSKKKKPSKVRNLKTPSKKITESKVKTVWKAPKRSGASKIKKYLFRLKMDGNKWGKWKKKSQKKLSINKKKKKFAKTYKNLTANKTYAFQVRAKNSNGKGAKNRVTFSTLPDCPPSDLVDPDNPSLKPLGNVNYSYFNTNESDWRNEKGAFTNLQTTQFVDEIPSVLTVTTPSANECVSIFDPFDDEPFATAGSGDPIFVDPPSGSKPQQLTVIPWGSSNGGCDINTDFAGYNTSTVIAIFVSQDYSSPPKKATVCKISANDAQAIDDMALGGNGGNKWTKGDCVIDRPRFRQLPEGERYTGSLYTLASDGKSKPLYIELADNAVLQTPLNAMVAAKGPDSEPCVVDTARRIIVTGFGRLDSSVRDYVEGKDNQSGKYKVDTGQLIVNSSASGDFPIDVSGLTISNSPVRNDAAVKLNMLKSCGGSIPDRPAKVFDVKRVVWNAESDAFELGKGAFVGSSWILSADDAIKISAENQRFKNMTVLQGNAGGVVNIGSYGYNYGTAGSSVDGVYVPRIIQGGADGQNIADPVNGGGGATGVIQTLTCPIKNLKGDNQNVTDVSINDFTIAALGGDTESGAGVNSYNRPFSLGLQDTAFCNENYSDSVTFGNFEFTNMDFYGNPRRKSELYIALDKTEGFVPFDLAPIRFCAGPDNSANCAPFPPPGPNAATDRPVTFWPSGGQTGGYYVCGTTELNKCWTVSGGTQQPDSGESNVDYYPNPQSWTGNVGFPYGQP